MTAYVSNIVISAGASFSQNFTLSQSDDSPTNLTGYAVSSYIRKHPESSNTTAKFTVGISSDIQGQINLSLASTISSGIKEGRYVYDILTIKPSGERSIIIEGDVLVKAGISS